MTIADILQQVRALSHSEGKTLVKQLIDMLNKPEPKTYNILEFEGIEVRLTQGLGTTKLIHNLLNTLTL